MPTIARLKLEFEEGRCPNCGRQVQVEYQAPLNGRARDVVEQATCPECGVEIVSEARGSRFWYSAEEFSDKDIPARRLVRCSREWYALAIELHLAAVEMIGDDHSSLSQQFERADAVLRQALAPALNKARDELAGVGAKDDPTPTN